MNKGYKLFLGFIFLLLMAGMTAKADKSIMRKVVADKDTTVQTKEYNVPEGSIVDEVIWVVGDQPILKSDVENMRMQAEMEGMKWNGDPDCVIPEQLAVQKLYLHQAELDSVEVTEGEVNTRVEQQINYMINVIGSREKLEEYHKKSVTQLRQEMHDEVKNHQLIEKMRQKLVENIAVTPSDVRKYFEKLPEDSLPFVPTSVEVEIITRQPKIAQEEVNRVKGLLREYTDRVTKGETSFATLARLYSEDPGSARTGGEMDYVGRGMLDPAFAGVAFNLTDPKKISKIVETEFGYHIIQLIDKRGDKIKVRHILLKPKVSDAAIQAAKLQLDSITGDIRNKKFSFEEAATFLSDDKDTKSNHGLMAYNDVQNQSMTSKFEMKNLPSEIALVVDTMKVGEISAPFEMVNAKGKKVVAVVKLRNRIDGHRAKITEDYQVMQNVVLAKEREKKLHDWVVDKIKHIYVKMSDRYKDCKFEYQGWVK
ncbi:peptidylprolyl isomerase [Prevotella sp. A2931]|uniref:Peptidylprolyl isomerase n=1 Tax=Prevotella illustrans TaxID=2800387 RepID=A0ABS3M6P8_9BACT|nr:MULTISPECIES: peptidylprolyl isomerase [Prevotella]MBO1363848.1 peptidylprolyl isomerase [Prevotella illustrans]PTL27110.1 peptidylprolyl isomerase [Prevotella sp. oral taxon 820]